MIRALYSAASGLVATSAKQDVIANNIANASTPGFKRKSVVAASFPQALKNQIAKTDQQGRQAGYPYTCVDPVNVMVEAAVDNSEGSALDTGNPLDLAIKGSGAFEIITPSGTATTREGRLCVDSDGDLATAAGKLQGQSGPIKAPNGEWAVGRDGSIISNGVAIDRIKIAGAKDGDYSILQGAVEGSNVNIVNEMVSMIANLRDYEANQKVITSIDQTLDKLINDAGRV